MIYTPNNTRESFPLPAKLRGITAYVHWLQSIGDDIHQIKYVDGFDWTSEHLPESIVPFLPTKAMTTEEADVFFAQFKSESREELLCSIERQTKELIERRMQNTGEDRATAAAHIANYLAQ